ncbi:MAG: response regulator transcription factor [Flavobacteriales bacterium]|nr:response regulator transcription factor [Flavobacteriales bacterium]
MSINLLLVDDHQIVIDGLKALLAGDARFTIKGTAQNGKEALEILRLLKVDVVLLDIDMPEMNGIDTTKAIRKEFNGIKIIILTMHDEKAMIKMLLNMGADGYLLKNSDKAELIRAIDDVMAGKQHLSPEATSVLLSPDKGNRSGKLADLTEREVEILKLVAEGLSNKEIGDKLFISHRTVDTHRTNLMTKLEVHNVAGLVRFAIQNGMLVD